MQKPCLKARLLLSAFFQFLESIRFVVFAHLIAWLLSRPMPNQSTDSSLLTVILYHYPLILFYHKNLKIQVIEQGKLKFLSNVRFFFRKLILRRLFGSFLNLPDIQINNFFQNQIRIFEDDLPLLIQRIYNFVKKRIS